MASVAYIRVSTVDQNTTRQLTDTGITFDKVFTDKCSGSTIQRPALEQMKEYVREGDVIHVHSIDRLARNLDDLSKLVNDWNSAGVTVFFHKESLTFDSGDTNPMSKLMLQMLGAVAQFELSMIQERRREGIAKAKVAGKYTGGKANLKKHKQIRQLRAEGNSLRKVASLVGVSLSTVQRVLAISEENK
ncbi:recombinase family protein [Colwellia sp. BRX10-3]|uniref:recombinase family protein n=1 Tax=Colwellia sp. BRX10-3 TaxID=2759844 RepID=UPI0015F42BD1|nr:recombinase family protein [Colwellia sp. BRX10-3]MBA6390005.1 recombinase family protein [Colwellia sp. BRX10-3]